MTSTTYDPFRDEALKQCLLKWRQFGPGATVYIEMELHEYDAVRAYLKAELDESTTEVRWSFYGETVMCSVRSVKATLA